MKNAVSDKWASIQTAIKSYHNLNSVIDFDWWEQQIQEINNEAPNNLFFALDNQYDKNYPLLDHYIHMVKSRISAKQYRQLRSKLNSKDCIGTLFEIILLGILSDNTTRDCIKIFDWINHKSNINECSIKISDRWISIEATSMKMYEPDLQKIISNAANSSVFSFWTYPPLDEAKRLTSKFEDKFPQLAENIPNVIFFLNTTNLYGNLIVDHCFNKTNNKMEWCPPPALSGVYFFTTKGFLKKYGNALSSYPLTENEVNYLDKIADLLPLNLYFK